MVGVMELLETDGIHPKKVSAKEYHSPCPACGGKDRFIIWPGDSGSGRAWCRQCGLAVDGIGYLRTVHHMTFQEAAEQIGKPLHSFYGRINPKESRREEPPKHFGPEPEKAELDESGEPSPAWSETAERFVSWTAGKLRKNTERLERLHRERGISPETAERWQLGWNPEPLQRPGEKWGLDGELSFPAGLVIPNIRDGKPVSLKIRRETGEPKYHLVRGSRVFPYLLPGDVRGAVAFVESEFDALLLWETARDVIFPIALGGCSNRPDMQTMEVIARTRILLDCLDNDPAGDAAGVWWKDFFPHCFRWQPKKKDPGEMHKAGEDVRRWMLSGIRAARREQGISTGMIDFYEALDTLAEPFPPEMLRGMTEEQIERAAIMTEERKARHDQK